jgi:hypothetical protein
MTMLGTTGSDDLGGLGVGVILLLVAFYVALIAFSIYIYVRIIHKAGYSGWWVLTMFVPVVNLVVIVMFAFAEWPVERRVREAETRLRALSPGGGHAVGGGYAPGGALPASDPRFGGPGSPGTSPTPYG